MLQSYYKIILLQIIPQNYITNLVYVRDMVEEVNYLHNQSKETCDEAESLMIEEEDPIQRYLAPLYQCMVPHH